MNTTSNTQAKVTKKLTLNKEVIRSLTATEATNARLMPTRDTNC